MMEKKSHEITCPACKAQFSVVNSYEPRYCPHCRTSLQSQSLGDTTISLTSSHHPESVTLIPEHIPGNILFSLGPYQILDSIGKGGMGEVFLAYDTTCGRKIALKKIREDLAGNVNLHNRFLKEARITSQLTHPAVIPIYSIHREEDQLYYTMPFIEGSTLKQILSHARQREKQGLKPDHLSTIPALMRIYLSVIQAVAYAHSKSVIHRDLKPNNIMVGKFGEVFILDWGLAKLINQPTSHEEEEAFAFTEEDETHTTDMTRAGRVVGTLAYMAPERARGKPANVRTDIYALGVLLYQILTLHYPFIRPSLKEFRATMDRELFHEPSEIAPYRDVPPFLAKIAKKCLDPTEENRYRSVKELIHEVESYVEGRSEWNLTDEMFIHNKKQWAFQEHVLLVEHMAITRRTETADWVNLMISEYSFPGNIKIEGKIRLEESNHGIGFLLCVPEEKERAHLTNGYFIWIGSEKNKNTRLLKDGVEVIYAPEIFLQPNLWYTIRIEKIENNVHFFLNDTLQFSYISYLPQSGTHIGFLSKDTEFQMESFLVYLGSENITLNCLAVPDAFLAHKKYDIALNEYRRIAYAFPGTAEAREAIFRSGITLLEEARNSPDQETLTNKSEEASLEFGKLRSTPGAPLEYLGKSLVYQLLQDYEEEFKCFEIAHRRYHNHPLLPILQEQLIFRMHESSRTNRKATYHFVLLASLHFPLLSLSNNTKKLFTDLQKHWEILYFIKNGHEKPNGLDFAIPISFWLAKPYILSEIVDQLFLKNPYPMDYIENALFALLELGAFQIVTEKMEKFNNEHAEREKFLKIALAAHTEGLEKAKELYLKSLVQFGFTEKRTLIHLLEEAIHQKQYNIILDLTHSLPPLSAENQLQIDTYRIHAYLMMKKIHEAGEILHQYPLEQLIHETTPLHFLYGIWLYVTEGKEIASIHFTSVIEVPYPQSWATFSHFYNRSDAQKHLWLQRAFMWERRMYFRELKLFYHCIGNDEKAIECQHLADREYVS